MREKKQEKY